MTEIKSSMVQSSGMLRGGGHSTELVRERSICGWSVFQTLAYRMSFAGGPVGNGLGRFNCLPLFLAKRETECVPVGA